MSIPSLRILMLDMLAGRHFQMPILKPCTQCGGPAYARRASDTARLCWSCYRVAPKRFGRVYLESSDTPMPDGPRIQFGKSKATRTAAKPKPNYLPSSETPSIVIDNLSGLWEAKREQVIDAYWEKHPELTRKQVEKRVK